MTGTNTLAYVVLVSDKEKKIITLEPEVSVKILFNLSPMYRPNKLDRLSLAELFQPNLVFMRKAIDYPCFPLHMIPLGWTLGLTCEF